MTSNSSHNLNHLLACPHCDAISERPDLEEGYKAICKQCGCKLLEKKKDPINRSIAISFAGLVFMIPALFIPMIGMQAMGKSKDASVIECIYFLIDGGYFIVAMLVFLFVIAFPLVRLITIFYVCASIKFNRIKPSLKKFYRSFHIIETWTLLNVFFLGVIVSLYKLLALAEVLLDWGLVAYILALSCSTLVSVTLDNHMIWHTLENECGD